MQTVLAVAIVLLLFVVFIPLVGYLKIKWLESWEKKQREEQKRLREPSYSEVVAKHRQEKLRAAEEAWRLADSIEDPDFRKIAHEHLRSYGVRQGSAEYPMSAKVVLATITDFVEKYKEYTTVTPADKKRRFKKLERLIELCKLAISARPTASYVFSRGHEHEYVGDFALLQFWERELSGNDIKQLMETWPNISAESFLAGIEKDDILPLVHKYLCSDCRELNPKRCSVGHCLNCAKSKKTIACLHCARSLSYDICQHCSTIKPVRAKDGRCLKCAEQAGKKVCWDCKIIDPECCDRGHCQNCSGHCPCCGHCGECTGYGSRYCSSCD